MDKSLVDEVVQGRMTMNIFSTYAPQEGLVEEIKAKFWEDLEGLIQMIPREEKRK